MQRSRRRVAKRQRNEEEEQQAVYMVPSECLAASESSLACQKSGFYLDDPSLMPLRVARQGSDASTDTTGPMMLLASPSLCSIDARLLLHCEKPLYIGNSHCPVDGWYQACR
jgi:hypothetical protein